MMKKLILLRGLPGAGKSTFASIFPTSFWVESDMYFEDADGNYNFDISKLKEAHEWCRNRVNLFMDPPNKFPADLIVVSNTFTQEWEMESYYTLAEKYGYRVHSLIVENRHGGVNEHGVPEDKIEIMKNRFNIKL
jgi:hypothetical protein